MGKEDLANKPVQIREKIVEGRIAKRLAELALLEQPYIRDDKVPVKDLVKEITAKLGEKIQVGADFLCFGPSSLAGGIERDFHVQNFSQFFSTKLNFSTRQ